MSTREQCPHDPRETTGPIGMYHCPDCGEMVLAGMAHPEPPCGIEQDEPSNFNN